MAKRFAGFTPEQLGKIIPEMAGMQSDEQAKFLAATPSAAARVNMMSEKARAAIEGPVGMAEGGMTTRSVENSEPVQVSRPLQFTGVPQTQTTPQVNEPVQDTTKYPAPEMYTRTMDAEGRDSVLINPEYIQWQQTGMTTQQAEEAAQAEAQQRGMELYGETAGGAIDLDTAKSNVADSTTRLNTLKTEMGKLDPTSPTYEEDVARYQEAIKAGEADLNQAMETLGIAQDQYSLLNKPSKDEMLTTAVTDPESLVTKSDVEKIKVTDDQMIGKDVGQVSGDTPKADVTTADGDYTAETPEAKEAVSVDTATVTAEVQATLDKLSAATGKPSDEALVDAATMSPDQLAQLGLSAAQIQEAIRVQKPTERTLQEGELISGSSVDMDRVTEEIDYTAATGTPSSQATVQGQLTGLMKQFEGGATPPWAAGAMRAAAAQMAARGLSASSMAGQAIVQATMESSINIASVDAATFSRFEERNLSNKQQMAVLAAEQRANFLNLEFTQDFQAKVENASKITEIANANYNTDVQIALENSRNAQSVQLANLNAQNAKILADAAAMTNIDMANLSNRQQAAVTNAKAFLEMDMANLDNEQQTATFKAQGLINALFNDQAAENASRQFNATSQMQTDQFYDNLSATVSMFNAEQRSTIDRFNAGEINSAEQLYVKMKDAREQFNAQNSLLVEQANTAWLQSVSTADTAAQNLANRDAALAATGLTSMAFEGLLQESRDIMSFAWQTENNDADRAVQLMLGKMKIDEAKSAAKASGRAGFWGAIGKVAASAIFKVPT